MSFAVSLANLRKTRKSTVRGNTALGLFTVHLDIIVSRKTNLLRSLFLVYFVHLYMFRWYLGPSSGGTTVCIHQLVLLFFLDDRLLSWLDWNPIQRGQQTVIWKSNPTRTTDSHLKRIISTNCCMHTVVPPDDGPRYARNM